MFHFNCLLCSPKLVQFFSSPETLTEKQEGEELAIVSDYTFFCSPGTALCQ